MDVRTKFQAMLNKTMSIEEKKEISDLMDENNKNEIFFENQRIVWSNRLEPIFKKIHRNNFTNDNIANIVDAESELLSHYQNLNDEVRKYTQKLINLKSQITNIVAERRLYYAIGFDYKFTNKSAVDDLIARHTVEHVRKQDMLENYIEFLRDTMSNVDSARYSIKDIGNLYNYLK